MIKKSAYIITKPLQYINATNIQDSNNKDCYIIDNFNNLNQFAGAIKSCTTYWNDILISSTKHKAFLKILINRSKYSKIFLDSDFGIVVRLMLYVLYPINIYVYEEGLASYTQFIRPNRRLKDKIMSKIDYLMGGKTWSGGAYMTKGIYLYHIKGFKKVVFNGPMKKKLLSFNSDFNSHVASLKEIDFLYKDLNFANFSNKNILIYLTAGVINPDCFPIMQLYPDHLKILKLHPNEKLEPQLLKEFDYSFNNTIPAEVLLCKLYNKSRSMIIIHESSAAMLNVLQLKDITEYNIGAASYKEKYEEIKNAFLEEDCF
jgi:hypothetical protein